VHPKIPKDGDMSGKPTILAAESPAVMGPILSQERIALLDILRGFAIFGILLVNMELFNSPAYPSDVSGGTATADHLAAWLIRFFGEGKFYTLFSFLFGLGFSLQMARAASRAARFRPVYGRRLFVLLLIGLAHALLVWAGDILVLYAVLGVPLLLFRASSPRTLIVWALVCLVLPILFYAGLLGFVEYGRSVPQAAEQVERWSAETAAKYEGLAGQSFQVYSHGTFAEITAQRIQDLGFYYLDPLDGWLVWAPHIFAMFLTGLYVGRRGFLQHISTYVPIFRKSMWWGLGLGLSGNLGFVVAADWSDPVVPSVMGLVERVFFVIGAPALSLFYATAILFLVEREGWQKRLAPLAGVGRMALSNYLLQSVICTTIFYSYGLGLYGRAGPAAGVALTAVIFLIQVVLSVWWLRRFQFGPMEWVWRSLTYRKRQPMRAPPVISSVSL